MIPWADCRRMYVRQRQSVAVGEASLCTWTKGKVCRADQLSPVNCQLSPYRIPALETVVDLS